jgi:dihydrofolate reductase
MDFPFDPKMGEAIGAVVGTCTGLLLGRNTFEMFAPAWSVRSAEDDPGAPFFNESPKYVVSSTLESAEWNNTTILGAYDADALRSLKDEVDGDIYMSGSGTLVRALLADGLVDDLHLFVYPVVLGAGQRLFPDGGDRAKLKLAATNSYENGVVHLNYQPAA